MEDKIKEILKSYVIPDEIDDIVDKIVAIFDNEEQENKDMVPVRKKNKPALIATHDLNGETQIIEVHPEDKKAKFNNEKKDVFIGTPHDED